MLPIEDGRQTEGGGVDGRRGKQPVSRQDARADDSFQHSAADDLADVLEAYARPDRRVNDRRVSERRAATAETSPDASP